MEEICLGDSVLPQRLGNKQGWDLELGPETQSGLFATLCIADLSVGTGFAGEGGSGLHLLMCWSVEGQEIMEEACVSGGEGVSHIM